MSAKSLLAKHAPLLKLSRGVVQGLHQPFPPCFHVSRVCHATGGAGATPKLKLTYWDLPLRAEPARVLLTISKVPFEDAYVARDKWPELKPSTPFGHVPVLEVDGTLIAQSGAINRYAAKLAGLFPEDLLEAAKADMASLEIGEAYDLVIATFSLPDDEAKLKARAELLEGKLHDKLAALDKFVAASGGDYVLGSKLSWADVHIYAALSTLQGGFIDGIPRDLTNRYPSLKKLRNAVASLPDIKARYANAAPNRTSFQPDA